MWILPIMANYRRAFVPGGCWFFTLNRRALMSVLRG